MRLFKHHPYLSEEPYDLGMFDGDVIDCIVQYHQTPSGGGYNKKDSRELERNIESDQPFLFWSGVEQGVDCLGHYRQVSNQKIEWWTKRNDDDWTFHSSYFIVDPNER